MKTAQMALEENLVTAGEAAKKVGTTQSGFTRRALRSVSKSPRKGAGVKASPIDLIAPSRTISRQQKKVTR
jgi:hypothetical protein